MTEPYDNGGIVGVDLTPYISVLDEEHIFSNPDLSKLKRDTLEAISTYFGFTNTQEPYMDEPHGSNTPDLAFTEIDVKVRSHTDGTNTLVQFVAVEETEGDYFTPARKKEYVIGEGRARRRSGDRRDRATGFALATARALRNAADRQQAEANKLLGE
jgi:hypothetical protein